MSDRWLAAFRQDPQKAVSDLFTGRAGVGISLRLDVPEWLCMWFPPSLADERAQLDDALLAWLVEMRESYTSQVERRGLAVYGLRVREALVALQLLDLPRARDEIRQEVDDWMRWLTPLRQGSARDPALECYRLLTYGQPDEQHTSTWLRLAADGRREYLTVALAGLRQLPTSDARKNDVLMLQALLTHAAVAFNDVNGALRSFNDGFGALRGRCSPRPRYWQSVLEDALPRFQRQATSQIAEGLARELCKAQPANDGKRLPHACQDSTRGFTDCHG